ncbi:hypothetical protein K32_14510 [Kaistia sp. 32K]|uniref:hypothetical protein n=1 Tax=Kaistia sp. 32K TaxID=2795690 RepID=UPI001916677F|nr:hypothetical protein [Kaistia sp. 32K]BCP52834.1 hypothetical protein K32_14510 [Kaistia sp. 32K]
MPQHTENMASLREILSGLTRETAWPAKNEISREIDIALSHVTWSPALGAAATDTAARCFEALQIVSRASSDDAKRAAAIQDSLAAIDELQRVLDAAEPVVRSE